MTHRTAVRLIQGTLILLAAACVLFHARAKVNLGVRAGAGSASSQSALIEVVDRGWSGAITAGRATVRLRCMTASEEAASELRVLLRSMISASDNRSFLTADAGFSDPQEVTGSRFAIASVNSVSLTGPVYEFDGPLPFPVELSEHHEYEIRLTVRRKQFPTVSVSVRLTSSGQPLDVGRVDRATAVCRGKLMVLKSNGPGVVAGAFEFRTVTPTADRKIAVSIQGRGFADQKFELDDPGTDVATLACEREVRLFTGSFRGYLVDAFSEPIRGETLKLIVRESLSNSGSSVHEVVTDERGDFTVSGVEFPCAMTVARYRFDVQFVPEAPDLLYVDHPRKLVYVRQRSASTTDLVVPDSLASRLAELVRTTRVWLEVLPLSPPKSRVRNEACPDKYLLPAYADALRDGRRLTVGHLPRGSYRVTLVAAELGTWSTEFQIEDSKDNVITIGDLPTTEEEGAELPPLDDDGIIIDGYVSSTLAVVIRNAVEREPESLPSHGAISRFRRNEPIRLGRRVRDGSFVTVATAGGAVLHYRIDATSGCRLDMSADVSLSGRVVDGEGRPLAGVAVNLTSLRGGEDIEHELFPVAIELSDSRTDADGRFELTGITPAAYVLSVAELEIARGGHERNFYYAKSSLRVVELSRPGMKTLNVTLDEIAKRCKCGEWRLQPELHCP